MDAAGLFWRINDVERKLSELWKDMSHIISKIDALEEKIDEIQSTLEQRTTERIDS